MKTVYIAYTFPPKSTGSAPMNLRVTRLLVDSGVEPTVITPRNPGGLPRDLSLEEMLPEEVRVVRRGGSGLSHAGLVPASVRRVGGKLLRRLIYITYAFPPVSTGSAARHIKVTRLLVRMGWTPTVITPRNPGGLPRDLSLEEMLPEEVRVVRKGRAGGGGNGGEKGEGRPSRLRGALRRFVLETLIQPDRFAVWVPCAVDAAMKEARATPTDLIITLGPPHSVHLAGMICSVLLKKPWVAYFGDLWLLDGNVDWASASPARRFWNRLLERWVVKRAHGIITTTEGSSGYFAKRYPGICPPVATLWNGVTREEAAAAWNPEPPPTLAGEMMITYTGFFMGNQSPEYFLRGMKLFLEKYPLRRVMLRIVGDLGSYAGLPERMGLSGSVELPGKVPFREVAAWQRSSHLLLVLLSPQDGSELKNPAKTVECLLARRPVLAVAAEGDLTGLIRELNAGYTAGHDADSVCAALESAWDEMSRGEFRVIEGPDALRGTVLDMEERGERMVQFLEETASRSARA